jgi:hypothetical protein
MNNINQPIKQVRFAKGTTRPQELYPTIDIDCYNIDEKEFEKNCHFTETQFAAACRDNIQCEFC